MEEASLVRGLVATAEAFAREAHAGQVRKGAAQEPYAQHLADVAALTRAFGGDTACVAAAWLHDTVEDCEVELGTLEARFGPAVSGLVAELTDDKSLDKRTRKHRQIRDAPHKSAGACRIKLADKTSNLRALAMSPPSDWDHARRMDYVHWAVAVVARLPLRPPAALATFLDAVESAERAIAHAGLSAEQAAATELDLARREAERAELDDEAVLTGLAARAGLAV